MKNLWIVALFVIAVCPILPCAAGGAEGNPSRPENSGLEICSQEPLDPTFLRDISQSPLFALLSGIASMLGLLLALYPTQVRPIPFSLYRSLMWRKMLLLAGSIGLLVFSATKFYTQDEAPAIEPLGKLHTMLLGVQRVSPFDGQAHGPSIWALLLILAVFLLIVGISYDPEIRAREILIREQKALQSAQEDQLKHVLGGRQIDDLPHLERRMFNDALEYFRHVQWRFTDVVLGAPPPTFPLFRRDPSRANDEDSE